MLNYKKNVRKLTSHERHLLEEKIKLTAMVEDDISDEEIVAIKQGAYEDYLNYQEYNKQRIEKKEKRRTIATRLVVVTVVAVVLFVAPFVYSVLMPVTMSKADNFMRNAAIWLNDNFHLGINIVVPPDEGMKSYGYETKSFSSLIEAAKETGFSIIYLPEERNVKINNISHERLMDNFYTLSIVYDVAEKSLINITVSPMMSQTADYFSDATQCIELDIGHLYVWEGDGFSQASIYYNGYLFSIYSSLDIKDFVSFCSKLEILVY